MINRTLRFEYIFSFTFRNTGRNASVPNCSGVEKYTVKTNDCTLCIQYLLPEKDSTMLEQVLSLHCFRHKALVKYFPYPKNICYILKRSSKIIVQHENMFYFKKPYLSKDNFCLSQRNK